MPTVHKASQWSCSVLCYAIYALVYSMVSNNRQLHSHSHWATLATAAVAISASARSTAPTPSSRRSISTARRLSAVTRRLAAASLCAATASRPSLFQDGRTTR